MQEIELSTWSEYVSGVEEDIQDQLVTEELIGGMPNVLFRGHASADWKLQTTLERSVPGFLSVSDYYSSVYKTKHQLEAFTDRQWPIPKPEAVKAQLKGDGRWTDRMPALNYLVYLRHHGFPSPLLDWSRSPFIAAFFAFQQAKPADKVAIYALRSIQHSMQHPENCECFVKNLGYQVRTHRRHFVQQAEYTIAVQNMGGKWSFTDHEQVLASTHEMFPVLHLKKYILPGELRHQVLKTLDSYNLNAYTLYGSDDALVESLAYRVLPG